MQKHVQFYVCDIISYPGITLVASGMQARVIRVVTYVNTYCADIYENFTCFFDHDHHEDT